MRGFSGNIRNQTLRTRYYIIFVAREKDGPLRKIPIPLHYAGVFVAAAVVGAFTITGLAGAYTRMLLKTASFNQVRLQQEALRKDYSQLQRAAREKDMQAASLGSLASEVSALYGLRQNRASKSAVTPVAPGSTDTSAPFTEQAYTQSLDQLAALRTNALSGSIRSFDLGMTSVVPSKWVDLAGAPSLWPITGPITSSFGEREDPFNGEGAFHSGVDISGTFGEMVRATADGTVEVASMASGYGREIVINHGNGIQTLYGHLSGFAVTAGQQISRGQVIGYVGISGRSTGPHLHYEVRIHNTPVNPYRYLRQTMEQLASADADSPQGKGGN
ncbi:MAG TPA: M23 family metallopeptidase [Acidobacteriaceae bacterium]|jgi:murein DD-endopeptidase MepM/ murein hydrolase activator NlpD